MVASNRSRFGSSGRRNDRSNARLITDICRTDQQRFTLWQKDGRQINQMKTLLRLIDDLTQSTTRYSNRLRYILLRAYPVAQGLFSQQPDQAIFASVPGASELLAPKLLVMFGTHCDRYARPADIQALAGTCPIAVQSGKKKVVRFRRGTITNFATQPIPWP